MNNLLAFVLPLLSGVAIGLMFFGGLWWTVRNGLGAKVPALYFVGSLLIRTTIALSGFYLVGVGHWQRLVICLVGSVIGRVLVMLLVRRSPADAFPIREAIHEA
jgi:F1F0 ATPase subunit 2